MSRGGVALIALFSWFSALSQSAVFNVKHLSTDNGLSHDHVLAIIKDRFGYMWFGTEGGLNRYDGYEYTVYRNNLNDSTSIHDNYVHDILEDANGNLLIGVNGGLEKFDHLRKIFIHHKIKGFTVRDILEDHKKNLWLASDGGLFLYDVKKGVIKHFTHVENDSTSLSENLLYGIAEDHQGNLWIASRNGLNVFKPGETKFRHYFNNPRDPSSVAGNYARAIFCDSRGQIWVGTRNAGVSLYDPSTNAFVQFKHLANGGGEISHNDILSFCEDARGNIWIGTENGGIDVMNPSTHTVANHKYKLSDPVGLNNGSVYCMYQDDINNMWIGTYAGGVNFIPAYNDKFQLYRQIPSDSSSLTSSNVLSVGGNQEGEIWIGTDGSGLNVFNPKAKTFIHYKHSNADPGSITTNHVFSILEFDKNTMIITYYRGGFDVYDKRTKKFSHHTLNEISSLPNPSILVSCKENADEVWLGTSGIGMWLYNIRTQAFRYFTHNPGDPSSLPDNVITSAVKDHLGRTWFGTSGGLCYFEEATQTFQRFVSKHGDNSTLSHNSVYCIFEDRHGRLWIGTAGGGLNLYDRQNNTFLSFTENNGLANNTIFGILEDRNDNLWLSTNKGISRFNTKDHTFRNFDIEDGVQGHQFRFNAAYQSTDGEMYFGGTNGLNAFYPDKIQDNPFVPPVHITGFEIFNKPVDIITLGTLVDRDSSSISEITLSYKESVFSITFAALNFTNPDKNQYAYKLDGFDPDWNYVGSKRSATYTNLDPGTYTFSVMGSNNDGIWNRTGVSLKIVVTPPFWKTWWFRALGIVAFGISLLGIYRLRVRQIENQKRVLTRQVYQRTAEIVAQKEEIETQKENIEEKNLLLERQFEEIRAKSEEILQQKNRIEDAQRVIHEKNEKLEVYNMELENMVTLRTDQLHNTLINLKETNKELDQFIYRSAHDLRGPIASILGLCHLGELESDDPQVAILMKRIGSVAEEMATKLSRLIKIHEINASDLNYETIDIASLIERVLDPLMQRHDCSSIQFEKVYHSEQVLSDGALLFVLLNNLLENAIKFKDVAKTKQTIRIEVSSIHYETVISITDNGIGIPSAEMHHIFDLFVVATESNRGFGVGLYEAKLIARRLNGDITLGYSNHGETVFTLHLNAHR